MKPLDIVLCFVTINNIMFIRASYYSPQIYVENNARLAYSSKR